MLVTHKLEKLFRTFLWKGGLTKRGATSLNENLLNCLKNKEDWIFWIYKIKILPYWKNGFGGFTKKDVLFGVGLFMPNMDPPTLISNQVRTLYTQLGDRRKTLIPQRT